MNQKKIGLFIHELRKKHGFTQKDLAERIGVSDKTISKWENGINLPDMSILPSLCETLQISVNELICGEHIPSELYTKKAEENLMDLFSEKKQQKRIMIQLVIGIVLIICSITLAIVNMFGQSFVYYISEYIDFIIFIIYSGIIVAGALMSRPRNLYLFFYAIKNLSIPVGVFMSTMLLIHSLLVNEASALPMCISYDLLPVLYSMFVYIVLLIVLFPNKKREDF